MNTTQQPSPQVRAYIHWLLRHARVIWIVALLLAIPATWRTASMYLHLRSEIEELLPRDAPSVKALGEMRERSPGLQFLGVVAEVDDVKELPAAQRFLQDLAARIRKYPGKLVKDVRADDRDIRAFLEHNAALYVDLPDLQDIHKRIAARKEWEAEKGFDALLDEDEKAPSVDFSAIQKKYEAKRGEATGSAFASEKMKTALMFVEAGDFSTGAASARALLAAVQADAAALSPAKYAPSLKIGYASDVAINVEEMDALESDLSVSSILVMIAVIGVILLYYRWWRAVVVLLPPLLIATVYAFGLASLPPANVTELNSNTAFLGSIIVGNGINVGLVLLARYREERMRGLSVEDALVAGVWGARTGTLAAALAAGVAYASLMITEFRGFRQFGVIGGLGMVMAWLTAFVLMPPLLKWLDDGKAIAPTEAQRHGFLMRRVVALVQRGAPVVVLLAAVGAVLAFGPVRHFDASQIETNFNKLRRYDTWTNGAGFWGNKMDTMLGHYLTPTVMLFDTQAQAEKAAQLVRARIDHGKLGPLVGRVVTADDVLPQGQEAKVAELAATRALLTPRVRAHIAPEQLKDLDRLLGDDTLKPLRPQDLPRPAVTGLREKDGQMGRTVLVYPAATDRLWKAEGIDLFVEELRAVANEAAPDHPGRVAGSIPLSGDILSSIGHDAPLASAVSLAGVILVVLLTVRAISTSLQVIASLLLGVLWLCGAALGFGVKLNFTNFIALPITFGIGVDYAVNVMARYVQDGRRDVTGAVQSTGGAVALCSMTTIIGYSSLLLAKNQALFLFGTVAVMGEVACLTTAVVVLPAALLLLSRWRGRKSAAA